MTKKYCWCGQADSKLKKPMRVVGVNDVFVILQCDNCGEIVKDEIEMF